MLISKDEDIEQHMKREPNSCFVNNYFDVGLKAWQANMDVQPVFNEYKIVACICQYFSKTEDQSSQTNNQEAKEDFENKMHHHDTVKTIAKDYLRNEKCSVQENINHIFPEMKQRRNFLGYFVNTTFLEERVQVLLSEKNLANYQMIIQIF